MRMCAHMIYKVGITPTSPTGPIEQGMTRLYDGGTSRRPAKNPTGVPLEEGKMAFLSRSPWEPWDSWGFFGTGNGQ